MRGAESARLQARTACEEPATRRRPPGGPVPAQPGIAMQPRPASAPSSCRQRRGAGDPWRAIRRGRAAVGRPAAGCRPEPQPSDATPSPDSPDRAQSSLLSAQSAFDRGATTRRPSRWLNRFRRSFFSKRQRCGRQPARSVISRALSAAHKREPARSPAQLNVVLAGVPQVWNRPWGARASLVHKAH